MFTGIITDIGTVLEATRAGGGMRAVIGCRYAPDGLKIGSSIACDGICLTVTDMKPSPGGLIAFAVDVSGETLSRTTAGKWEKGRKINLEQAIAAGGRFDGHFVTGHVDGCVTLISRRPAGDSLRLEFEFPQMLTGFLAEKGAVALDGVSLTVNGVEKSRFWVNIIPHTLHATTLGEKQQGDALNLEIDLIARYVSAYVRSAKI